MLCPRCQKSLRGSEGIKCGECDSRYHVRCVAGDKRDMELECGDRGFHWICATCQTPASKTNLKSENAYINQEALLNAINNITEKFELVNKIQLPKLSNDLLQIKFVTERIIKQNENLLVKIDELKKRRGEQSKSNQVNNYRRRNLNLTPPQKPNEEQTPILGGEKIVRYRTRRRSYPLLKMLLQLNRKLRRCRATRR